MIVLDTHAWVWWVSAPEHLSSRARAAIDQSPQRGVSAISCWEISMLAAKGRLSLDRNPRTWLEDALFPQGITLLPLSSDVAWLSANLKKFHGDPADRIITATAVFHGARLVTKDVSIARSGRCPVVW